MKHQIDVFHFPWYAEYGLGVMDRGGSRLPVFLGPQVSFRHKPKFSMGKSFYYKIKQIFKSSLKIPRQGCGHLRKPSVRSAFSHQPLGGFN